ncbi:undecaprenyl-diphosphate phosphatase [soil metagenome]
MNLLLLLKSAFLGIVEGLTEFLPISSTGHLILADALVGFGNDIGHANAATFEIAIQTGAMVAIIWQYWPKLLATLTGITTSRESQRFALNVFIAFLPAVVFGLLLGSAIKARLFNPVSVALAFIVGGVIILLVERALARSNKPARVNSVDDMTPLDALKVGLAQCLALVPGTSRSGATIIGSMLFGFSRKAATEFSFYLAIPTLIGAGAYAIWKQRDSLSGADVPVFAVGSLFAFVSALLCIRWLIRYVSAHDFKPFAWYRIVFGVIVLIVFTSGWLQWEAA